ncbi:MAG: NAD(P)/FAD-dependent oxidoreductase [Nitrososphaerales archaeon]
MSELPVVVVGAGAAGLMAAIWAAGQKRAVVLLESTDKPGQKILISGGGRCNVLPSQASESDFHTDGSINTLRKILAAWPLIDICRFFEKYLDVPLALEKETGKVFPASNQARTVLDALMGAARNRGVDLRSRAKVTGLERSGDAWSVKLEAGEPLRASRVVLATGGLSVPSTGSDGAGLRMAQALGHLIIPTYPALTPLTTSNEAHKGLAGVSVTATASTPRPDGRGMLVQRGGFLFTHRGYSGPAVLNISHVPVRSTFVGGPRPPVFVSWGDLKAEQWDAALRQGRGGAAGLLRKHLPERLAAQLLTERGLLEADLARLRREDRARLVEALTHYALPWSGHEGYRVAEVTGGGVGLDQVNPATLESRVAPGLYLCGEMLDAFGPIGGYNFLWAWVTGKIAGLAAGA